MVYEANTTFVLCEFGGSLDGSRNGVCLYCIVLVLLLPPAPMHSYMSGFETLTFRVSLADEDG